jgi:hypothetical protein
MEKTSKYKRLLLIFLFLLVSIALFLFSKESRYKWVFVYYMSYDNDLNSYGRIILNYLDRGITNNKIAVVTQADFMDEKGMRRIAQYRAFGKTWKKEDFIQSEDSADIAELKKYFNWIRDKWKAENYCVVFLNHGGLLNNMCKDEEPYRSNSDNEKFPSGKWLPASKVGKILAEFNRDVNGKVRLLFLQQCGRGSIQNLYSFVDTSEYIMASPVIVGAPNTYYTQMLKEVTNEPNISGTAIAETIMNEDKHYNIYSLIDSNELKKLPEKLNLVLESFSHVSALKLQHTCLPMFEHEDEKFYDLQSYFTALSSVNNNIAAKELENFFDWCDNNLIVSKRFKDYDPGNEFYKLPDKSWRSGLSIYVPSSEDQLGRYDFLPLYQQTNLGDFMQLTFQ